MSHVHFMCYLLRILYLIIEKGRYFISIHCLNVQIVGTMTPSRNKKFTSQKNFFFVDTCSLKTRYCTLLRFTAMMPLAGINQQVMWVMGN